MSTEDFGGGWVLLRVGGSGMAAILVVLGGMLWLLRPDLEDARPPRDTTLYPGQPVGVSAAPGAVTLPQPPSPELGRPSEEPGSSAAGSEAKGAGESAAEQKPDDASNQQEQPASGAQQAQPRREAPAGPENPPPSSRPSRTRFGIITTPPLPTPPPEHVPKPKDSPEQKEQTENKPQP